MENQTKEQAIINVMAANMSQKIAQLEGDKAVLMVETQLLKEELESLKKEKKAKKEGEA